MSGSEERKSLVEQNGGGDGENGTVDVEVAVGQSAEARVPELEAAHKMGSAVRIMAVGKGEMTWSRTWRRIWRCTMAQVAGEGEGTR